MPLAPFTAGLLLAWTSFQATAQPPAPAREGWRLVWHEEFEGDTLDQEKWRVEHAALVKNNELQFYAADEVYLEEGCLVLRSRARDMGGRAYTSGLVDTNHRFSQAFGRFEIRARIPSGRGIWPAHWMLPENHPAWPPEIDIMEALGHEPDTVYLTQHWGTWPDNKHEGTSLKGPDFSDDFHTFAMEWSPERIDWFVDEKLEFSRTSEIPQIPFHIILNTAIGGDWPGNPDESTRFPQHHLIDYVRVYSREQSASPPLTLIHPHGRIELEPPRYVLAHGDRVTARAYPDFGYRFVGWDEAGAEQALSFTIDGPRTLRARFEPDPHMPPLLKGAKATASSSESEALGPEFAVDGFPGTRWGSAFSEPQVLTLDLGGPTKVDLLRILWESAHARRCEVETSNDGIAWRALHTLQKESPGADILTGPKEPVRFVRLRCTERATRWGVSVWELEAYGSRLEP